MRRIPTLSQRRQANGNRRQRKKHYAGEFQELGFTLRLTFPQVQDAVQQDAWFDVFIGEIERLGLAYGGGAKEGYVCAYGRGTVTPAQRDNLLGWLRQRAEVASVYAGPLQDAWHGDATA